MILGCSRPILRKAVFGLVRRICETDDGRLILSDTLRTLPVRWSPLSVDVAAVPPPPYQDLVLSAADRTHRDPPIFITGRFRSGSTLLWNLFRHVDGCTAYYEPLNERRWFDPAIRGSHTDETHRNVSDYWREYAGLERLRRYYREHWTTHALYMDATAWNPDMHRFVQALIDHTSGRPVLQFNRVDFRLGWLRAQFPEAAVIHVYRHPRDQWVSTLMGDSFPLDGTIRDFAAQDRFYLLSWARDLMHRFPFLDERTVEHPYELFYFLWKLSYLFGRAYAHVSVVFEDLVRDPATQIREMLDAVKITTFNSAVLSGLVVVPAIGHWKNHGPAEWFLQHEERCERILGDFMRSVPEAREASR